MKFKPIFDRVLIKPEENQTMSSSGIILPQTSQERPQIGVVVAVGDGENVDAVKTEMKIQVGDKVLFSKYAGVEIKMDNELFMVLRQIDVLGVFNE